jgi:DNA-directed RNA polymerase specialized sigma24 family protein
LAPFFLYLLKRGCVLSELINEAGSAPDGGHVSARVYQASEADGEGGVEAWIRVSGTRRAVDKFLEILRLKRIRHKVVYRNPFSVLLRLVLEDGGKRCSKCCRRCLLVRSSWRSAMVKTIVASRIGVIFELVAESPTLPGVQAEESLELLAAIPVKDVDYYLSEKQEEVIIYAFLRGFYDYPRRVSLTDIARELGLSPSTVAEVLRRAERKVVEAFVRHEMPHYYLSKIVEKLCSTDGMEGPERLCRDLAFTGARMEKGSVRLLRTEAVS